MVPPDFRLDRWYPHVREPLAGRAWVAWVGGGALLALLGLLLLSAWATGQRASVALTLDINGQRYPVQSRQRTVGALLREQGVLLAAQDIVYPPRSAPLSPDGTITLFLARDVTLTVDGRSRRLLTHAERLAELLLEQGITLKTGDRLLLDGEAVTPASRLPLLPGVGERPQGQVVVDRSLTIVVEEGGIARTLATHEHTVGEALWAQGIVLHEGDRVVPALSARIEQGLLVRIERTTPYTLTVDGHARRTRSALPTVGDVLAEQGVALGQLDRVTPPLDAPLHDDVAIQVTRVAHRLLVEQEALPYESVWMPTAEWELDTVGLYQAGREGLLTRETLVVYEDGVERERSLVREVVERPPQDEIYAYGTRIVVRTVDTPQGPRQYWRKIRANATSYTAATSGKSRDHPEYGITRTGLHAGYGVVAVDPRLIALRSSVYVPGYGVAIAGDTGGAIKGRRIDLGYNEGSLVLWYQPVDVYLLTPIPPLDEIDYTLP